MKTTSTLIVSAIALFTTIPPCLALSSPDGKFQITLAVGSEENTPTYQVVFDGKHIIRPSAMGFLLQGNRVLGKDVRIKQVKDRRVRRKWKPVYGERSEYPDNYNESTITLADIPTGHEIFSIKLRAFNEGVAFRYELPPGQREMTIEKELTEFSLAPESWAWATDRSQGPITKVSVSEITVPCERPLLVESPDSIYLAIGEACQVDFARMKLVSTGRAGVLRAHLESKVVDQGPFDSPWRFIMAGQTAGEILEHNYLILNLNEPNQIDDPSWLKPGKVIRDVSLTTTGGKACVDFAASHGLQYVIESAGWYGNEFTTAADATTVTLDPARSKGPLDIHEVIRYGKEKGIDILVYVNRNQLEKQLDEILPLYHRWGIKGVKYGFVRTGSQRWTSWMHEAVRKAAEYQMVLSIHDDYRPVGYSRTYPNLMTQEGIRGDEESPNNAHTLKTMFTRMIAGAGDNTICYFAPRVDVMGSHASQLAKSVCLYSPLQWLYWYDRPATAPIGSGGAGGHVPVIEEVPELEFFDVLPTVWDDTKVIHSDVGELGTIARKSGDQWFVGTVNANTDRLVTIPLGFLDEGKQYVAVQYFDDPTVDTPTKVGIEKVDVGKDSKIIRKIAENNGLAIWIYLKPKDI